MTAIKSLADVRPGDIYLGPIGGPLGVGIRAAEVIVDGGWRVGPLHVEHIGIVTDVALPKMVRGNYVRGAFQQDGNAFIPGHWDDEAWPTVQGRGPLMVQAMRHGAEEIELSQDKHWTAKCAYARIPEDYPGQAEDAAAIARLMVEHDVAYSFASYAALALYRWGYKAPRLTEWIGRRQEPIVVPLNPAPFKRPVEGVKLPVEAICSVLADQCWSLAGKRVMEGTAPQAVTPSQLGQRLLTGMDGVIWGWPSSRDFLLN